MGFICQAWKREHLELRVSSACILFPSPAKGLRKKNVLMDLESRNLRRIDARGEGYIRARSGNAFLNSCESHLLVLVSESS